ncbi:MAG: hypothetical protein JW981_03385 [Anaerolineae bacterium]|nr:hypothetical protein [Anaerolineae bacterium]
MTEETVIEGEVLESPEEESTGAETSKTTEHFDKVLDQTGKFLESLGKAVFTTAQTVTQHVWVHVDGDTRKHLDMLVESGAAKNRPEAAVYLIGEGIKAKRPLFEKIERTNEQISSLKQQLRSMTGMQITE